MDPALVGAAADAVDSTVAVVGQTNDLLPYVTQLSQDVSSMERTLAAILALLLVFSFLYAAFGGFRS